MTLTGTIDGHGIRASVRRAPPRQWRLLGRGFHWITEYPFNR